jgi:Glutathione S-transferase, N-terminal domain
MWVKFGGHPCWRVQRELDNAGVDYVVVKHAWPGGAREEMLRLSGQKKYPVIEFEDGSIYREESKQMADTIKSGRLMEKRGGVQAAGSAHDHEGHEHDHQHAGPPPA